MPWTAKQLKLFRAAAHDPAIAKARGIKQSDARRMMNEGLKKAGGGMLKQKIGNRDTKHGLLDLPVAKQRRFNNGGVVRFCDGAVVKGRTRGAMR